ncbi:MAG: hypothetical protein ACRDNZ_09790 [Streptosporangiaceae bacterium]
MPGKNSMWTQLQRERDQRARAAAAAAMKADVDARIAELRAILVSGLVAPPRLAFPALRRSASVPSFDPGDLRDPLPPPRWEDFAPPPPGGLAGLLVGKARGAHAGQASRVAFENAVAARDQAEADRVARLHGKRQNHDQMVAAVEAEVRDHNAEVDEFERSFTGGVPDAVEQFFGEALGLSEYPGGFVRDYQVAYRPEPRELVIEYRLPGRDVVRGLRDFRYVKARGEITETVRMGRPREQGIRRTQQQAPRHRGRRVQAPARRAPLTRRPHRPGPPTTTSCLNGHHEYRAVSPSLSGILNLRVVTA